MRPFIALLVLVFMTVAVAVHADSTSNVKVGLKQGGEELYVKAGGSIKVRDEALTKILVQLSDIGTASNGAVAVAPYPGSLSVMKCGVNAATTGGATAISARINGTLVTGGVITVTSTASTAQTYSVSPSAANTLAAGDVILVESDGGTTASPAAGCVLTIAP